MGSFHALAAGAVAVLLAGHAGADASTSAAAQALFDQGKKLMASGRVSEGCSKLQESQRLEPGGGTILLLARCHAKEGRTASSWAEYQDALRVALRDNRKEREKIAREEGLALESRLSKMMIVVPPGSVAPGLATRRDGQEVGSAQWSLAVAVDPGRHEVTASAPGRANWSTTVEVRGEGAVVSVVVPPLREVAVPERTAAAPTVNEKPTVSEAPRSADDVSRGTGQRVTAVVVGAAGVVLLGVGGAFGLKARSTNERSQQPGLCTGGECHSNEGLQLNREALVQARTATILSAIGGVALVGGATLWLTAPANHGAAVAVAVGPGQLTVRGAW